MLVRADTIVPELLVEAVQGAFSGMKAFYGTGAATVNSSMPTHAPSGAKINGGDTIKIPYFGTVGEMEDVTAEGDALTPTSLTMSEEECTVTHSGKAIEISFWAQMAANYADPYGEMARQLTEVHTRRVDKALFDVALASLPAGMTNDIQAVGAGLIDYDAIVDTLNLWGDEEESVAVMVCHSDIKKRFRKIKDANGHPIFVDSKSGGLPTVFGIPMAVSNRQTKSGSTYRTILARKGALAYWAQSAPRVLVDTDVLADTELAAIHTYWCAHRYSRLPGGTYGGVALIQSLG
jgi:HK97 family phage major capsid protein